MAELNHFAIAAGMGAMLGPRVSVNHGQIGSSELAATLSGLMSRRKSLVEDFEPQDDLYEKAVTKAYLLTRQGFSSDRVLADPAINKAFVKACSDLGVEDTVFHLNLVLIGLRKHNKLKAKSKRSLVPDQWRYAVASEIAARVMYYRHHVSVDTTLAHPEWVKEFDRVAASITPGFSPFEYRWAALNMRKKGSNSKIKPKVIEDLDWSKRVRFDAVNHLPSEEGVYTLYEEEACLFVAGTEDLRESMEGQQTIAQAKLFEPALWRPNVDRLSWRYVRMPDTNSDYRFGVVRSLVGRWEPIFNIPRGKAA